MKDTTKTPPKGGTRYTLKVPIDASQIEERDADGSVRVFAIGKNGALESQDVKIDAKGNGVATFAFAEDPGAVRVIIAPEQTAAGEVDKLQTIERKIGPGLVARAKDLVLEPIRISPYYWRLWFRRCRTFTIRGRLVCPNGNPVPGARVCAYDIDGWWWWVNQQQVGCDVTDADGSFEIKFRWCCGFTPWWWWQIRKWRYEPVLAEHIIPELVRNPKFPRPPLPDPAPRVEFFQDIIGPEKPARIIGPERPVFVGRPPISSPPGAMLHMEGGASTAGWEVPDAVTAKSTFEPAHLESLRDRLATAVRQPSKLAALKIWPWYPWQPWYDCSPDIIFRATQTCMGVEKVIVNENIFNTRWNIPTTLDVTLVASADACCIQDDDQTPVGNCMVITNVCGDQLNTIGGNVGAPFATPRGYYNPQAISYNGDRPYAGTVPISGLFGNAASVDYYEFEWFDGSAWQAMPSAAAGGFGRSYWGPQLGGGPVGWYSAPFPFTTISGRNVVQSRENFEATNDPGSWGTTRFWASNRDLLMNWLTDGTFGDGTYRLRVVAWDVMGGALTNRRVLPVCNLQSENEVVIRIDNRLVGPGSGHPASAPDHPTGPGTIHLQTMEPDTDILSVRVRRTNGDVLSVKPCSNNQLQQGDMLVIDFLAYDPDAHLAYFNMIATYGENEFVSLIPGSTLKRYADILPGELPATPAPVPAAVQVGPTYGEARTQGAPLPVWRGGAMRLEIPAHQVFKKTCCYQLELRAYKRTIVNCSHNFDHNNLSEYSFMIVV